MSDRRAIGPYRLVRPIGAGGAAEVWEAIRDGGSGPPAALKIVRRGSTDAGGERRFLAEAALLAALHHPNIVEILEVGVEADRAFLAMELLAGQTLGAVTAEGSALPAGLVVALGLQLMAALEYAHTALGREGRPLELVHRDVKPTNLFVTTEGTLKLIDFGIALARDLDRTATRAGAIRGSFPYLSPEQARGEPLDARSDLFSAGLVLHELLTGRRVFAHDNEVTLLNAVMWAPIPGVRSRQPDVPAELSAVVDRMLKRDLSERTATAAEVAAGLAAALPEREIWSRTDIGGWIARAAAAFPIDSPATRTAGAGVAPPPTLRGAAVQSARARRRGVMVFVALGATLLMVGWAVRASRGPSSARARAVASDAQPRFPVRAAFYYLPHIESVPPEVHPPSRFHPTLAGRGMHVDALIERNVAAMIYGHFDVGISSWRGIGAWSDEIVPKLLAAAEKMPFRWTLYHETEGRDDPDPGRIHADLVHIASRYASHRAFFRVNGRFVLFVYSDFRDGCKMVQRWVEANRAVNAYLVLRAFPGREDCAVQPDAWHSHSEQRLDRAGDWSATIAPGAWHANAPVTLERNLERWRDDVRWLQASRTRFHLVVSFNEWFNGTAIDSAQEWASPSGFGAYLDVMHELAP